MNPYFAVRKVVQGVSLVVLMTVVFFVIFRLMPGNPADLFLFGARNHGATPGELQAIEAQLGLQGGKWSLSGFLTYMKDMFTFNFGFDYYNQASVWGVISAAMPYTLLLLGTAAVISWVAGIPLGIVSIWTRGKKSEGVLVTTGLVLNSFPYFILAVLLFLYFAVYFRLAPVRSVFPWTDVTSPSWPAFVQIMTAIALPLATLTVIGIAAHLLTMRASMVSVLGEDYITTARAKGVGEGGIMFRHAARNAMIPVSTRMALEFALLASGAIITEIIFSYPGIGHLLYQAILNLDYPLIEGTSFLLALIVIIIYSMIDFIHAWLDPRIHI
jgi:peptide/nickel transport system permease protein